MPRRLNQLHELVGHRLMRVTLAGLDELDRFPTEEARRQALDRYARRLEGFGNPRWWFGFLLVTGGTLVVVNVTVRALPILLPLPRTVVTVVVGTLGIAVFLVLLRWFHRVGAARALRVELLQVGVPVCRRCGYLLEGLPADSRQCPECGRELGEEALEILRRPRGHRGVER